MLEKNILKTWITTIDILIVSIAQENWWSGLVMNGGYSGEVFDSFGLNIDER